MIDIGIYHPQIVHFVVAFLFLGVVARIVSFLTVGGLLLAAGYLSPLPPGTPGKASA